MIEQPSRLFWAGVMDSMAKMLEIMHRLQKMTEADIPLGFDIALVISERIYNFYDSKYEAILEAVNKKEITKDMALA